MHGQSLPGRYIGSCRYPPLASASTRVKKWIYYYITFAGGWLVGSGALLAAAAEDVRWDLPVPLEESALFHARHTRSGGASRPLGPEHHTLALAHCIMHASRGASPIIQKFRSIKLFRRIKKISYSPICNGMDLEISWPWKVTIIQLATRNFPRAAIEKSTGNSAAMLHKTANFPRISASIDVCSHERGCMHRRRHTCVGLWRYSESIIDKYQWNVFMA